MNTTFRNRTIAGVLSLVALGAVSASAMGFGGMMSNLNNLSPDEIATRQTTMFQEQAALIGATTDEVKNAWADGKDFKTLAAEKGVTEAQLQAKIKAKRDEQMKANLATLVSKGVITQAQADKRLATIQTKEASGKKGGRHGGMGMGLGL
jgi:predicted HTH transcriptional regulator